jgi:hypothetical protein
MVTFLRRENIMKRAFQILILMFLFVGFIPSQGVAGPLNGSFEVNGPYGAPDYSFYDLGNIAFSGSGISIMSNDSKWGWSETNESDEDIWVTNGWPGVVLDKIFFAGTKKTDGIFTADVELTISDIYGGNPFPAVINPDILALPLQNTSGILTGDLDDPETLEFKGLKIYAIVSQYWAEQNGIDDNDSDLIIPFPENFFPWQYANDGFLYDPTNNNNPRFYLTVVGTLNINAEDPPFTFELTPGSSYNPNGATVPEPATMLLLGLGLVGLVGVRRKIHK